jgi:peptidoglycan-associated lipoprotein
MKRILWSAIALSLLSGCPSTPETPAPGAEVVERKPPAPTPGATAQPAPSTAVPGAPMADWMKDPRLKDAAFKRSVYFDFDKDEIKPEYVPVVEAHAQFLRQYRGAKMLIQGNADERGSREYNIGLGQRRADTLRKRLVLLGATASQIESVSLGEEKPVCAQHAEDCWWKNRRGDMLYSGEY